MVNPFRHHTKVLNTAMGLMKRFLRRNQLDNRMVTFGATTQKRLGQKRGHPVPPGRGRNWRPRTTDRNIRRKEGRTIVIKIWRLSYSVNRDRRKPHLSLGKVMTFFTVAEALEHVRLLAIPRFHLEDRTDTSVRTH